MPGDTPFQVQLPATAAAMVATVSGTPDIISRVGSGFGGGLLGSALRFPTSGGFAMVSPSDNFAIFINALQAMTDVKMLSAPHIIAADNREVDLSAAVNDSFGFGGHNVALVFSKA